ncbi:MAG TPA: MFS transporter [Micromonosporaceae bacterium]|jgi:MFS family permease|nr:MFS transporter [Micromonosporaceae bacterium]
MSFTSPEGAQEPGEPRWGDVYLSAAARGVSTCGDVLAATALVLALQAGGAGGFTIAALLLAESVPLLLLAPVAGRLADRVDSRLLVVTAGLAQAVVCTALAFTGQPVAVIALVAVLSTGLAVTSPTLGALVPDMVGLENMPRASAIGQTATSLGMLAGPALAGVLVGQFGVRVPLLIDAATFLAIAAVGLVLRTRRGGKQATAQAAAGGAGPDAGPGWRLRGDVLLLTLVVAVSVSVAAVTAVNVADVFFVRVTLHASTTAYGLVTAVWTAAMLGGSWLAARAIRKGSDGALAVGLLGALAVSATMLVISAGVPSIWWLIPLWVIGGVLNGGENVMASVFVARRVPAPVRGRALGIFVGAVNGANVFGYLAGGLLLAVVTPRSVLALSGVAGLVIAVACLAPVLRAARRERAAAPVTPGAPGAEPALAGGYRPES